MDKDVYMDCTNHVVLCGKCKKPINIQDFANHNTAAYKIAVKWGNQPDQESSGTTDTLSPRGRHEKTARERKAEIDEAYWMLHGGGS